MTNDDLIARLRRADPLGGRLPQPRTLDRPIAEAKMIPGERRVRPRALVWAAAVVLGVAAFGAGIGVGRSGRTSPYDILHGSSSAGPKRAAAKTAAAVSPRIAVPPAVAIRPVPRRAVPSVVVPIPPAATPIPPAARTTIAPTPFPVVPRGRVGSVKGYLAFCAANPGACSPPLQTVARVVFGPVNAPSGAHGTAVVSFQKGSPLRLVSLNVRGLRRGARYGLWVSDSRGTRFTGFLVASRKNGAIRATLPIATLRTDNATLLITTEHSRRPGRRPGPVALLGAVR